MKRKITFLTAALALLAFLALPMGMRGQTRDVETFTFSELGYDNAEEVTTVVGDDVTLTFGQGSNASNAPKYYNTGTAVRMYTGNTLEVALSDQTSDTRITAIDFTFSGNSYTGSLQNWTGSETSVSFTNTASGQARIQVIAVTLSDGSTPPPTTYTVTYYANVAGVTSVVDTYNEGANVTLRGANTFTNEGYTFDEWNTQADGNGDGYAAGDVINSIDDDIELYAIWTEASTPTGSDVTFDATQDLGNTDAGSGSIVKDGVTFACDNGVLGNGTEYRLYKNSTTNFSVESGTITQIVFTCTSTNPASGFGTQAGWTTNGSNGTWTGSATSVSFVASSKQVRATQIVVTVDGGGTPAPSIVADNVEITYDAISGEITYTINNGVDGGTVGAATESDWLTLGQGTASPIEFTCTANEAGTARTATVTLTYTYNREAVTKDVTVTQAGDPNAVMTIAEVRTQGTGNVATKGVVTSCVGTTGYIQDATAAICVFGTSLTVGDEIRVSGTLDTYKGLLEIKNPEVTVISQGNTVNPEVMTIADINASTNQGWYIRIENATVTEINDQNTTIAQGENTIVVRGISGVEYAVNDIISLDGNIGCYNVAQIANPTNVTVQQNLVPTVTVTPATISAPAEGAEGNLALAYENITEFYSFDFYFCDANGEELQEDPDWIDAEINPGADDTYILDYLIDANNGEARTAYIKVYTFDDNLEEVYAIVTVNQAQYVIDYATLPFEWEGGASADFLALNGVTAHGLGSDYGSNNAPYLIKFDGTGDYIQVKTNEQPGKVTIGVKMIGGASTSTITIQGSADGETFTDVEELTISGAQNDVLTLETTNAFAANVRYVRMLFTKGSNVGVGPISIAVVSNEASIAVNPDEVNVDAEDHDGTLNLTYENLTITEMGDFDIQYYDAEGGETTEPDWMEVLVAEQDPEIGEGYVVSYWMMENEGAEARTAYFKVYAMDDEGELVYSNLVTITQAAPVAPVTGDKYVKVTSTADLTSGQYLIVYEEGNVAFDGGLETLDAAGNTIGVTIQNDEISITAETAAAEFTIDMTAGTIKSASGLYIGQTSDANGMQSSDETAYMNTISIDEVGNAVVVSSDAHLRYNNASNQNRFRYYKSTSYEGQKAIQLYKKALPANSIAIEGYANCENPDGGYYLIASPFTVAPADVPGMTDGSFDLYYFTDEEEAEWINYKNEDGSINQNFGPLTPGKGYLYAHETDVILTFDGEPYEGNGEVTLSLNANNTGSWKGWNLVGNPYTETAYIDRDFYVLNGDGSEIVPSDTRSYEVAPMQGIFVVAAHDEETMTFSTDAGTTDPEGKIVLNVRKDRNMVIDRAMIRFGEGRQLPKFMLNPDNTKLYIAQNGEDYAVVRCIDENITPVSFSAAENGTYTISVNAEEIEMEYLHLVDNMTGADIDLLATPSYTFDARTTDYTSRFNLVFATTNGVNENSESHFAFYNGSEWVINNMGNATLQVVDVTGRVLSSESIKGNAHISLQQVPGVYMMRLVNGDNVKVQKVVVR